MVQTIRGLPAGVNRGCAGGIGSERRQPEAPVKRSVRLQPDRAVSLKADTMYGDTTSFRGQLQMRDDRVSGSPDGRDYRWQSGQ